MKEEKVFLRSKSLPQEKACNNLGEDGVWRIFETFKKRVLSHCDRDKHIQESHIVP